MAYDPQANRPRPKPAAQDPAPVEALLDNATDPQSMPSSSASASSIGNPVADDPPPSPSVTPNPADPPSDALLINTTLAGAIGAVVALIVLRHFWRRHKNANRADPADSAGF